VAGIGASGGIGPPVARGAVGPEGLQRCIELAEEHGPGMVPAPGVAPARARPEDGALRLGRTVTPLARPVFLGRPGRDPPPARLARGQIHAVSGEVEGPALPTGVLADVG